MFNVPSQKNAKLERIVERINADAGLQQLWKSANVMMIDRMAYNDHGPMHAKLVSNIALKMLRMLVAAGIEPSAVRNYHLSNEDAEVIVVLASALHDLGNAIHREEHEFLSVPVAVPVLDRLLEGYPPEEKSIFITETLHAMVCHHEGTKPWTLEAGIVRIADALDMEKGRARIPFREGKVDIHSVSALAIDSVELRDGGKKPIRVVISMNNSAGIFQIDNLLKERIRNSGLEDYVQVSAEISTEKEKRIIERFEL